LVRCQQDDRLVTVQRDQPSIQREDSLAVMPGEPDQVRIGDLPMTHHSWHEFGGVGNLISPELVPWLCLEPSWSA